VSHHQCEEGKEIRWKCTTYVSSCCCPRCRSCAMCLWRYLKLRRTCCNRIGATFVWLSSAATPIAMKSLVKYYGIFSWSALMNTKGSLSRPDLRESWCRSTQAGNTSHGIFSLLVLHQVMSFRFYRLKSQKNRFISLVANIKWNSSVKQKRKQSESTLVIEKKFCELRKW